MFDGWKNTMMKKSYKEERKNIEDPNSVELFFENSLLAFSLLFICHRTKHFNWSLQDLEIPGLLFFSAG